MQYVYVLSKEGKPLMPTKRFGKVRHLLKDKKAKVVRKEPFTIQLLYDSKTYTQPITLGVDAGSRHIGLSASTKSRELLAWDVELRTDISDKISTRSEARKARRSRKTRYRPPRFLNRIHNKPKGWITPSVEQKIRCHLEMIRQAYALLPIQTIIVETAQFDTQKLKNPEIQGAEYQNGVQKGFSSVREYVLFRDGHTCQHCRGKSGDQILQVHHLESRKTGGNAPDNLITLCKTCHDKYHGLINQKKISGPEDFKLPRRAESYRDAAFMGIVRKTMYKRLQETYPDVRIAYGYQTKSRRFEKGLAKTHVNDALCISENLDARPLETCLHFKKIRRHNRQIHKFKVSKGGKRKANQAPYLVCGFRLFDKVEFNGQTCFITGRRQSGYFVLKDIDGNRIHSSVKAKDLKLIQKRKGYLSAEKSRQILDIRKEREGRNSSPA